MRAAIRISVSGSILATLVLVAAGCAQRTSGGIEPSSTASTSSTVTSWLGEDQSSIGVVALGPDQFLYQDWFEFQPAFRKHFSMDPTYTTVYPKKLKRRQVSLGDAVGESAAQYFTSLAQSGEEAVVGLLLAPALITVGSLYKVTVGEFEWVQPRPTVRPLNSTEDLKASIPPELLSKHRLAADIAGRVVNISEGRSNRQFLEVPFEQMRERSPRAAGVDGLITVRVQSVGLIADDGDDPLVRIAFHAWANFNRKTSSPFTYESEKRKLSEWGANNARLLRKEIALAIESLAVQITDATFPTA